MTDADKMHKAISDYAITADFHSAMMRMSLAPIAIHFWQAAKESARKELEASRQSIDRLDGLLQEANRRQDSAYLEYQAARKELEAAKQAIRVWVERFKGEEALVSLALKEKEALEKKFAGFEATRQRVISGALYDLFGWLTTRRTAITMSEKHDSGVAVDTLIDFAKMRGLLLDDPLIESWQCVRDGTEELTKLLAVARKEGFEEGKLSGVGGEELMTLRAQLTESQRKLGEAQSQNNFDATRLRRLCVHFGLGDAVPVSDEELLQVAGTVVGSVLRVAEKNRADDMQAGRDELLKGLMPTTVQPLDTVNYWADAYAANPHDQNLAGRMIVQLLREHQEIRRRVEELPRQTYKKED